MAYVFIDDGYPEASEFADNYVYFNPADATGVREALNNRRGVNTTLHQNRMSSTRTSSDRSRLLRRLLTRG